MPVDEIVYGEPINVIISGHSDPRVLEKRTFHGGLSNYFKSFGFAIECFGLHKGTPQSADLGDGQGWGECSGSVFGVLALLGPGQQVLNTALCVLPFL